MSSLFCSCNTKLQLENQGHIRCGLISVLKYYQGKHFVYRTQNAMVIGNSLMAAFKAYAAGM